MHVVVSRRLRLLVRGTPSFCKQRMTINKSTRISRSAGNTIRPSQRCWPVPTRMRLRQARILTKQEPRPKPSRCPLGEYLGRCQQPKIQQTYKPAVMFVLMRRAARPAFKISANRNCKSITTARCMSSMADQSIPVVLIGRTGEVGKIVTEALKPEYEGQSYVIF